MATPQLTAAPDLDAALSGDAHDAVILIAPDLFGVPDALADPLRAAAEVDQRVGYDLTVHAVPGLPGGRLVAAPTGPLDRDQDDVRRVGKAAAAGVARARDAGARRPLLVLGTLPTSEDMARAPEVAALGALAALWEPLEAREALGEAEVEPVEAVGLGGVGLEGGRLDAAVRVASAVEAGRRLARDLGGTEPERMAPIRMASLCEEVLGAAGVEVEVVSDRATLDAEYPLLSAVARASYAVERHHPRVVRLRWRGAGEIRRTLLIAGKGVSYDTGGADLKTGGIMAGMSRDKGGAAAAAGFLLAAAKLAPEGVEVIAELGCVRNSIGPDSFVSDEIIPSHAGTRVRIGNTDAEGRLVMADLLSHLRVRAVDAPDPHLYTLATLTGHAGRAVGNYSIAMDNGPARGYAERLSDAGDAWGDPFSVSRLRPDDFDFVRPRTRADQVLSCNNAASSATPRGHQFPMAFLILAAGLAQHDRSSDAPLAYTHLDVGGSGVEGGDWQHGRPSAAPVTAMAALELLKG